jgi:prepilin-type N-terminal cleavage/methylation domain-containing protein
MVFPLIKQKNTDVGHQRAGLTLIEILVVLTIIVLLISVLIPATTVVQKAAKDAKQYSHFSSIELAMEAFKSDYTDYPPSYGGTVTPPSYTNYCGAQKLAEAMLGWDLLGFYPKSDFRADGRNNQNVYVYDVNNSAFFDQRKTYLEQGTSTAFKLGSLFTSTSPLAANTYVLCDVYGRKKVRLPDGATVLAGAPILYYRADTTKKTIRDIYNYADNGAVIGIKDQLDNGGLNRNLLGQATNQYQYFYDYIRDPKKEAIAQPYNNHSYILISAGADGLYGTSDDIRNFGK